MSKAIHKMIHIVFIMIFGVSVAAIMSEITGKEGLSITLAGFVVIGTISLEKIINDNYWVQ